MDNFLINLQLLLKTFVAYTIFEIVFEKIINHGFSQWEFFFPQIFTENKSDILTFTLNFEYYSDSYEGKL